MRKPYGPIRWSVNTEKRIACGPAPGAPLRDPPVEGSDDEHQRPDPRRAARPIPRRRGRAGDHRHRTPRAPHGARGPARRARIENGGARTIPAPPPVLLAQRRTSEPELRPDSPGRIAPRLPGGARPGRDAPLDAPRLEQADPRRCLPAFRRSAERHIAPAVRRQAQGVVDGARHSGDGRGIGGRGRYPPTPAAATLSGAAATIARGVARDRSRTAASTAVPR